MNPLATARVALSRWVVIVVLVALHGVCAAQRYTVSEIPTLGGAWSAALGLSDSGHVVGSSETGRCYRCTGGFTYRNGEMAELPTFGPTPRTNQANAVNNRGQVVGYSTARAFLYSRGTLIDLGTLGGTWSEATAINDAGEVAGTAQTSDGTYQAFVYDKGVMHGLGTLEGRQSSASGINAAGEVVGIASTPDGLYQRPFLYRNGQMTDLGTLGGTKGWADGINNRGDVVGMSLTSADQWRATLWRHGKAVDIGSVTGTGCLSRARSINDREQVVGYFFSCQAESNTVPFLWERGNVVRLNDVIPADSGWVLAEANGINNRGQIVGTGTLHGASRGFLLTPTGADRRD